jgi:hypothetical protein
VPAAFLLGATLTVRALPGRPGEVLASWWQGESFVVELADCHVEHAPGREWWDRYLSEQAREILEEPGR